MKKNKIMRVASILLIAVLIASFAVSGSLAMYASTVNGSDSASVAKWSFNIGGSAADLTNKTFTFDLFNTIKDTDTTANETDVASNKIAPGTSGSFSFVIENTSDVNATYAVAYTVTNEASVPIEFKVGEGEWTQSLGNVSATNIDMGASATIAIQWRWAFDGDHTSIGTGASDDTKVTVAAAVTVEQRD